MIRILFVDDEQKELDGLQQLLRPYRHQWEMAFALGGEAALAMLACASFDAIVSDMQMPGMDGSALLERVRKQYPQVVRIVLSGYTELEAAFRAVQVAHQFLLKPCDADTLRVAIERACSLQSILSSETLAATAGALGELPSAPRVYTALTRALADPDSSLEDIARIVEKDVAISAKVLQLVNSAFFGLTRNITSLHHAVTYLGVSILQSLVISAEAFRIFNPSEAIEGFSIDEFQNHAGLTARITGVFTMAKYMADPAMVAGLLHDVGKLVLASRLPGRFREALLAARSRQQPLYKVEEEIFGVSHAEVGAYLLGLWGLPTFVTEAVAHHHAPTRVPHHSFDTLAAVYVANLLAHQALVSPDEPSFDPVNQELIQSLGMAERYPAWQQASQQLATEAFQASHVRG